MSRISQTFANKRAFIGYLTAGDAPEERFLSLIERGVNVLEVGIPFSDPVADGPVIQQAMERSLRAGTTPKEALRLIEQLRKKTEVAIVLFTYFNPIQRNLEAFLQEAHRVGADGVLIVDLPLEESAEYRLLCQRIGLSPIFVIAPSTPLERIRSISALAEGFIYYACRKGTTGARDSLPDDLEEKMAQIRAECSLPIAVGFGIASRKTADAVLTLADGFVVGSHFVEGNNL